MVSVCVGEVHVADIDAKKGVGSAFLIDFDRFIDVLA
jgi:hypothetical protein